MLNSNSRIFNEYLPVNVSFGKCTVKLNCKFWISALCDWKKNWGNSHESWYWWHFQLIHLRENTKNRPKKITDYSLHFGDRKCAGPRDQDIVECCDEIRATLKMDVVQRERLEWHGVDAIAQITGCQWRSQFINFVQNAFLGCRQITRTRINHWCCMRDTKKTKSLYIPAVIRKRMNYVLNLLIYCNVLYSACIRVYVTLWRAHNLICCAMSISTVRMLLLGYWHFKRQPAITLESQVQGRRRPRNFNRFWPRKKWHNRPLCDLAESTNFNFIEITFILQKIVCSFI